MSKLSFRARALDASKPLPIYLADEIPETADCSLINRAVPQMPTGMEKEEESVRIGCDDFFKCFNFDLNYAARMPIFSDVIVETISFDLFCAWRCNSAHVKF